MFYRGFGNNVNLGGTNCIKHRTNKEDLKSGLATYARHGKHL